MIRRRLAVATGVVSAAIILVCVLVPRLDAAFPGANGLIAFSSDRLGPTQIFVMDPDGSNPLLVSTTVSGSDFDARWSPDGTQIAFASDRTGFNEVFVMKEVDPILWTGFRHS